MRWAWKHFWQLWGGGGYLQCKFSRLRSEEAKINGNFEESCSRNFNVGDRSSSIPLSLTPSQHTLPPLPFPTSPPLPLAQYTPNTPITPSIRGRRLNREEPYGDCWSHSTPQQQQSRQLPLPAICPLWPLPVSPPLKASCVFARLQLKLWQWDTWRLSTYAFLSVYLWPGAKPSAVPRRLSSGRLAVQQVFALPESIASLPKFHPHLAPLYFSVMQQLSSQRMTRGHLQRTQPLCEAHN